MTTPSSDNKVKSLATNLKLIGLGLGIIFTLDHPRLVGLAALVYVYNNWIDRDEDSGVKTFFKDQIFGLQFLNPILLKLKDAKKGKELENNLTEIDAIQKRTKETQLSSAQLDEELDNMLLEPEEELEPISSINEIQI